MIAGHFATALVPYELTRKSDPVPVWPFLLAAQFLDVLMLIFVSLGIVFWFCRRRANGGQPVSTGTQVILYAVLVGTTLSALPLANNSVNSLLGL